MTDIKKRLIFKWAAISLPLLFILIAEGGLRLFGYGHNTSLFIPYPSNPSLIVMNKYASERYFSDTINATKGYAEPFDPKKQPGTLRLFVLGESTAEGYPYFHNGSFHRWLQYRLMHAFPDKKIEVINLALTAVNSYTVADFSKEIVAYQPDAVLIYVGHNEYYGALGVGSTTNIGSNRLLIKFLLQLRTLRIAQLLQNTFNKLGKQSDSRSDLTENLMKRMANKAGIPYKSKAFETGINQFEQNMNDVCKTFSENQIPVLISTLVSNEKDMPPLMSDSGDYSASKLYQKGKSELASSDSAGAKKHFVLAKEMDLLRFRAPEKMNTIINGLTKNYKTVHIVDANAQFRQHSAFQILGKETLLEHVHPNLYGYALLSDAFYKSLKTAGVFKLLPKKEMTFSQLVKQMPITKVDSINGVYTIMMLKAGWPFNQSLPKDFKLGNTLSEQLAGPLSVNSISWISAMNELFKKSMAIGDKVTALKATEAVLLQEPENATYYIYAARLNFELGFGEEAAYYFKRCYQLNPNKENAQNLYIFYLKSDQPREALVWLGKLVSEETPKYQITKALLEQIISAKKGLKERPENKGLKREIADLYKQLGEKTTADLYQN